MKFKRLRAAALAMGLMVGGAVVMGESPAHASFTAGVTCSSTDGTLSINTGVNQPGLYTRVFVYWYDTGASQWRYFLLTGAGADANGWRQTPNSTLTTASYPGYYFTAYVQKWENGAASGHFATAYQEGGTQGGSYCFTSRRSVS